MSGRADLPAHGALRVLSIEEHASVRAAERRLRPHTSCELLLTSRQHLAVDRLIDLERRGADLLGRRRFPGDCSHGPPPFPDGSASVHPAHLYRSVSLGRESPNNHFLELGAI